MKQVLARRGRVQVVEVPPSLVGEGSVLVAVSHSFISPGTEREGVQATASRSQVAMTLQRPARLKTLLTHLEREGIQKTVALLRARESASNPIGYSCAGTVVQVGRGVPDLRAGDQVACAGAGDAVHAELVVVPRNLVARLPAGCELEDAASAALGTIALQGLRRSEASLGEIVAVIGLGLIGQLSVQLLKVAGCRTIGIDLASQRVEKALALGLDHGFVSPAEDLVKEIDYLTEGHGVDVSIITAASSSDEPIQQAMEITRRKGRVVVVGSVGLGLQRSPFYEKEIDLLISTSYGPGRYDPDYEERGVDYPYAYVRWTENRNLAEVLRLLAAGRLNVQTLVERRYDIEQASDAYMALQADDAPLGIVLRYTGVSSVVEPAPDPSVRLRRPRKTGRIGVALVGAGSFAQSIHLPNLKAMSDRYHLRAVVSRTGSTARTVAEQFGAEYCTTDLDAVLADEDIQMVLIATRHDLHAPLAMAAAQAGKAVFLEKPMSTTATELEELVGTLQKTGVAFTIGFNRRFSPASQRLRTLLAARRYPFVAVYRVNAGALPPDHWIYTPEGGGRIIGEAVHMLDLFHFLAGTEVVSVGSEAIHSPGAPVRAKDNFSATLRFADGSLCTLLYTSLGSTQGDKELLDVHFDGKTAFLRDFAELRVDGARERGWRGSIQDKGHRQELLEFARFLTGEREAPIPLDELVSATRVSFQIDEALG